MKSFEYYSTIESKEIDWLWYPYIPYGKLTLIQGDPGEGKSTFIIQLISLLTNDLPLPDGSTNNHSSKIIYQCAEDCKEDTIKPRLIKAGADCSKVIFIPEENRNLTLNDHRLELAIKESKSKMVVLDPIQAFIPQDVDMHSATAMRNILGKLSEVAKRNECAIILIGHMNKSTVGKKLYRGLGSIDIAALARSILMISRDMDSPTVRYMYPVKSSLAPEGPSIAFQFDPEDGFKWIGKSDYRPEDTNSEITLKKEKAKDYLKLLLWNEDISSDSIFKTLNEFGISVKTVRNAKKELNIKAFKEGNAWYWHLDK